MGGMVAREVLERRADLRSFVSGALLIGSTPYGSVVGDYKARGDLFDDTYLQQEELAPKVLGTLAGPFGFAFDIFGFNADLHQLFASAEVRTNIGSMSHRLFDPTQKSPVADLPILNVIQLPDGLGTYFKHSVRSANVDPTFLLMSMYGPTEGSTPLSHAAWDSTKSARVFAADFNHLGFWSLDPDLAVDYIVSAIFTSKTVGLW
jgi:hypothetical protein